MGLGIRCRDWNGAQGGEWMKNIYDNREFFESYGKMTRSQEGLKGAGEWHQLKELFPDVENKVVLDLGCGYGWHCMYAASRKAEKILGIDQSKGMIEEARKRNKHERIHYEVCGLEEYEYPREAYDLVISNLVLHYVKDLDQVFENVYRTLKPQGVFLFNMEHPVFTGSVNQEWVRDENGVARYWPVDRYFYPGERKTSFLGHTVTKEHHTLTQIFTGLLRAGFSIEAVEEAVPPEEMADLPEMRDELRRPMMLMVRAKKSGEITVHTMEYRGGPVESDFFMRHYTDEDYEEYKRVYHQCFSRMRTALGLVPVECCGKREELLKRKDQIFICEENGVLVGSVAVYENEIDDLIVAEEFQRQGWGRKFLEFSLQKMQKEGTCPIRLHVADWNRGAMELYKAMGFVIKRTEKIRQKAEKDGK